MGMHTLGRTFVPCLHLCDPSHPSLQTMFIDIYRIFVCKYCLLDFSKGCSGPLTFNFILKFSRCEIRFFRVFMVNCDILSES